MGHVTHATGGEKPLDADDEQTPRVLVADDDPGFTRALCQLLRRFGYRPRSVSDSRSAIAELRRTEVDLLIADVHMPGNDSLELLQYVEREHPSLPVIIMTGRPGVSSAVLALRHGAGDYLVKPFDFDELHARIQKLLTRASIESQALRALDTLNSLLPTLSRRGEPTPEEARREREEAEAAAEPSPQWDALSEREREVVETFSSTPAVTDVASALGISVHTVRNHFRAIYRKLNVRSQAELIAFARNRETRVGPS
ncbi:MAG: response regulator transcription factor [Myxococcales bacterium]|nr:response regulator transcription factor [Myxococcales bacterium]MCB9753266.1 response regulator transcription factor [Myxococcales bacterium]